MKKSISVMLLAAGRGSRLAPITDAVPKPLITAGDETLIERHIRCLAEAGFKKIIINVSHLRDVMRQALGNGASYGVRILWSDEGDEKLGTGGGIANALPLMDSEEILVISSDIYTDWKPAARPLKENKLAHLIMVDNPEHHLQGDFTLENGKISLDGCNKLTFSGIGYYKTSLFQSNSDIRFELRQALEPAIRAGQVSGEYFDGFWNDAGTHKTLAKLHRKIRPDVGG